MNLEFYTEENLSLKNRGEIKDNFSQKLLPKQNNSDLLILKFNKGI